MEATCLTKSLLLLGLLALVKADVCDKNFLVRMEDLIQRMESVTQTNRELTETNRELNKTVDAQKEMFVNLTSNIEDLRATIGNLQAANEELNSTLSTQNMQSGAFLYYFQTKCYTDVGPPDPLRF